MLIEILQKLRQSLEETRKTADQIRELCRVPAISIGVLHEGEVVFTGSVGMRDMNTQEAPDAESLYTVCSISKTFVSAALGILVHERKIKWTDPVGSYLPEFQAKGDPRIAKEATFNDFLRHSSGLADAIVRLLGPQGKVLVSKKEFIDVVNETPTNFQGHPAFNRDWVYSNVAYGLLTLVIEKIEGIPYAQFIEDRILTPLGMVDTVVSKQQLKSSRNVAQSYAQLSDNSWHRLDHEWTDESNSPLLGMVGVRSSGK